VVLAGGLGRRIGGSKATVQLRGKPLISYPLEALRGVLSEVAVIAKADTELPDLPGVTVWVEPAVRHHPLIGITHALGLGGGRRVAVCAVDLPFVTAEVIRQLTETDPGETPAVVASSHGQVQPLLGCYLPGAAELLRDLKLDPEVGARDAVAAIGPRLLEVDPEVLFNVNTPDDLLQAAGMLDRVRARHPG
jgi:molybdopterin-guanine dinucleotide biosynthesis protein A